MNNQTSNDVFPEEREKDYKRVSSEYPVAEMDIDTKISLAEIINPRIAYYSGGEELNIKMNINVKNEEEKIRNYNLNKR